MRVSKLPYQDFEYARSLMSWSRLVRGFERSFRAEGWKVHQCSNKGFGASLIENKNAKIHYVIVGSDSEYEPLPLKRVERTRVSFSTYKGKRIDIVIFIGRAFSDEAKKKVENGSIENIILVELGHLTLHDAFRTRYFAKPLTLSEPLVLGSPTLIGDPLVLELRKFLKNRSPTRSRLRMDNELASLSETDESKHISKVVSFSVKEPRIVSSRETVESVRFLAFSDWRVQKIQDLIQFVSGIEPLDFVLYAGDDIARFEEEGLNLFSELSSYTKSGQVLAVIGNDDVYEQKRILRGDGVHDLYDRSLIFHNFAFMGLESATRGPAVFRHSEADFEEQLKNQINKVRGKRTVVLSHSPPYGVLDEGIRFAKFDENETHHIGSASLRRFLETHNIDVVVCGHCHSQGGMEEDFNKTRVVNVASHDTPGSKGKIAIIELKKDGTILVDWHDTAEMLARDSVMQIHGIGCKRAESLRGGGIETLAQLSSIKDLATIARKSGISQNMLKVFQLKAKSLLENAIYEVQPFNLVNDKTIFFDIETDLACERVWLIGMQIDDQIIQLYADNWAQEEMILRRFLAILKQNPYHNLVSYSTTNFDYRVTLNATKRHGLDTEPLKSRCHNDLGIVIQRCFILPQKSCALKQLGSFFGYEFKYPELNGLMVATKYQKHVEENKKLDPKILEYNKDDVKVLSHIIERLRSGKLNITRISLR